MLVFCPPLANANVPALAAFLWNDMQNGALIMLGALLLAAGTILRHRLSATQPETDSHAYSQWVEPRPANKYVASVAGIRTSATSQHHANVV
jgi:hypothetical protein